MIPQDVELCGQLTTGRNILLGLERALVDRNRLSRRERTAAADVLRLIGAHLDPRIKAADLSTSEARFTQIAHALLPPVSVILCDEPTAVLSEVDAEALLATLTRIRGETSTAIVYVSHRIGEVLRIADRITILRDGRSVGTFRRDEIDRQQLIELMTKSAPAGRQGAPARDAARSPAKGGKLAVKALGRGRSFSDVSFDVAAGQIVGIAGAQGAGFGPLLAAIAGRDIYDVGAIELDEVNLPPGSTAKACRLGIALVPADRRIAGIAPTLTVRENIALPVTGSLGRFGIRLRRTEREVSRRYAEAFDIRGAGLNTKAGNLSGGNQQKLAIARALQGAPKFLLLDEPTQGIDIGAKAEIRHLIGQLVRNEGLGALVASSEFEDLIGFTDVLHVMCLGKIVATFDGKTVTYAELLHAALP
jgi:ribose transport system ATP-binding protein/rhamnose transport system ATP-binding protein